MRRKGNPPATCPVCFCEFFRRGRIVPVCCSRPCKATFQTTPELLDRAWLAEQYVTLDKSSREIAESIGCDRKTVDDALRRHQIQMRRRGSHKNCRRIKEGDPNPMLGRHHTEEAKRRIGARVAAAWRAKHNGEIPMHDLLTGRRRGPDHPNWKGGVTPERQAFYATEEWKDAAREVWRRDCHACQLCGKKKRSGDGICFDIHHIVSFACAALRAVVSNLVLLCEECHYWVHSNDNIEGLYLQEAPAHLTGGLIYDRTDQTTPQAGSGAEGSARPARAG